MQIIVLDGASVIEIDDFNQNEEREVRGKSVKVHNTWITPVL